MSRWPKAHDTLLLDLWTEGLSFAQIARRLNSEFADASYSRNSAVGRAHRLGFSARSKPSAPSRVKAVPLPKPLKAAKPPPALRVIANAQVFEEADPRPPVGAPPSRVEAPGLRTMLTVRLRECRWPIGDPQDDAFTFCGASGCVGPYCASHSARAYTPMPPKKRTGNELARSLRRYV